MALAKKKPARSAGGGSDGLEALQADYLAAFYCNYSVELTVSGIRLFVAMNDYDKEKWFDLYTTALLELDRAAMTGRIGDACAEIAARVEKLKEFPALYAREREVIEGALRNLRVLEREEARLAKEEKQQLLRETMQKLQMIAPKFEDSSGRSNPE